MNNIPEVICIYKITSPTNKIYIGQTINAKKRFSAYRKKNCKKQIKLFNSIIKYGWENHLFEIIHECNESVLNELEVYYINKFNSFNTKNGLNLLSGGNHFKASDETKEKMSNASKGNTKWLGKKHTDESKIKMSLSQKGRKTSDEAKEKMSKIRKGRTAWNKGIKHTEETKIKMRISAPKTHSLEHIVNNRNAQKGKKHTEESKLKISAAHKGMKTRLGAKLSNETKTKISKSNLGKKPRLGAILSEETKRKISDANKGKKRSEECKLRMSNSRKKQ